jgi:hypothetical protein
MSTKKRSSGILLSIRIVFVTILLFIGIAISSGQEKKISLTDSRFEKEWWYPLIKKHNIDASQFTFWSSLKPSSEDSKGYTALELGTGADIKDTVLTIKDPVFIIRESEDDYYIVVAESAVHNLKLSQISWENGKLESFLFKSEEPVPIQSFTFNDLSLDPKTRRMIVKNLSGAVIK